MCSQMSFYKLSFFRFVVASEPNEWMNEGSEGGRTEGSKEGY